MYFDAHSDVWSDVAVRRLNGETDVFSRRHLERFRRGGMEGGIFVIWVDPPYTANYVARTRQIMKCVHDEAAECADLRIVHTYDEMMQARRDSVLYALIGVEGMAAIGNDIAGIDAYYDFGVRHAILTWNEANTLGSGALSGREEGLTELGKQAVRRIQERGMLLDVSHLNDAGFHDVVRLARRPFIASHSNCRALCDVPRNLTDDQMRAIRDADGVVGVNAYSRFIDADPKRWTVQRLAHHAAHMIDVMGIDHVCCGFDFCDFLDGNASGSGTSGTVGLETCVQSPNFFACLTQMGMCAADQEKIASGNLQRVIRDAVG